MKLVLITSILQYKEDILSILKDNGVLNFSYSEAIGHSGKENVSNNDNWFVGDRFERASIVFYAIVPSNKTNLILNNVEQFNNTRDNLSHIHVSVLNIEQTNF